MDTTKLRSLVVAFSLIVFTGVYNVFADGFISVRMTLVTDDARETVTNGIPKTSSLELDFVDHPANGNQIEGFRFPALMIPQGVTITNATIQFTCGSGTNAAPTAYTTRVQVVDSAITFSTNMYDLSSRPVSADSVTWNAAAWVNTGDALAAERTPDLSPLVQEIVSRPGWVSGSAIAFMFTGHGWRTLCTVDGTPASAALLYVAWTSGVITNSIIATAGPNGSISPSGTVNVLSGGNQTFTMTAGTGYHVTNVIVDGSNVGASNSYTFSNVTTNHAIGAYFGINHYTLTASAGPNGSINPSGPVDVTYGSAQTFTITGTTGYSVTNVTVDGSFIGATNSYTFTGVVSNHAINALFGPVGTSRALLVVSPYGTPSPPVGTNTVPDGNSIICSVPGSPVTVATDTNFDGFETGDFSKWAWTNSGTLGWVVQSAEKNSGTYAAKAGPIANNGSSTLGLTAVCGNGTMVFWRKVSSEQYYDWLTFYIDGVQQDRWSGEVGWSQVSYPVTAGTHVFTWTYSKDSAGSAGSDTAWIDDIAVPVSGIGVRKNCTGWSGTGSVVPANGSGTNTPLLTITQDSSITWLWNVQYLLHTASGPNGGVNVSDGWYNTNAVVTITATASNNYRFGGWVGDVPVANTNDNPLVLTMDGPRSITAQFKPLVYYITVASAYGTPAPPVGITSVASNSTVICSVAGSPMSNFSDTNVDGFESGDFSKLAWTNSGTLGWVVQSAEKNSGTYAAKAGPIGGNGTSTLELTIVCTNGTMTFWRKVSSEQYYDWLTFYIDGVQQDKWSGEVGWSQVSYPVTTGTHVFTWTYSKDGAGNAGSDTAWIDDIAVPVLDTTTFRTCMGWTGSGNVPASGTLTNTALLTITKDSSITWNWRTQYWLQTAFASNGTVNVASGWLDAGTNVTITATASNNYRFGGWVGDVPVANTNDNPLVLTMDRSRSITAQFKPLLFDITVASAYGTPTPPVGITSVASNSTLICSVPGSPMVWASTETNIDGFESGDFSRLAWTNSGTAGWVVQSVETNSGMYAAKAGTIGANGTSTLELTMACTNGNIVFSRKVSSEQYYDWLTFYMDGVQQGRWSGEVAWGQVSYPVTVGTHVFTWTYSKDSVGDAGSDTAWIDDVGVPVSEMPTMRTCTGWSGSGNVPVSGTLTNTALLTITKDSSITWNWRTQYWLQTTTTSNGTVNVSSGWLDPGTNVMITATADGGSHFRNWGGDVPSGNVYDNPLVLTMDQPRAITANFLPGPGTYFTITATAGANGSIAPTGVVSVLQGTSRNFVITPAPGNYAIGNVLVDSLSVGALSSYTFINVTNNHTINAIFTISTAAKGTPVQWLNNYGITNNYDVQEILDPDHDGALTWEEYIMGTNPTNGTSKLTIIITNSSSRVVLLCQTIPASGSNYVGKTRYYSMQDSTNISASGGTWQWIPNYTNITGDGSVITYTNVSPGTRRWFRIKARLQ